LFVKEEHEQLVKDLAVSGDELFAIWSPLTCHKVHMLLGLVGEVLELDLAVNEADGDTDTVPQEIIEELGDIEFYLAGLYQAYFLTEEFGNAGELMPVVEALLTEVKRSIFYQKPNLSDIENQLHAFSGSLDALYQDINITRDQVLQANIDKLRKRYGHTFSCEAANARRDKHTAETV